MSVDPHRPVATVTGPDGVAYRGKFGCTDLMCTRDGNPDRCFGWHCLVCDGRSNMMGQCVACAQAQERPGASER